MKPLIVPVRFFVYANNPADDEVDIFEVDERDFLEATGNIEYERHTVFANGVTQICLTKSNGFRG